MARQDRHQAKPPPRAPVEVVGGVANISAPRLSESSRAQRTKNSTLPKLGPPRRAVVCRAACGGLIKRKVVESAHLARLRARRDGASKITRSWHPSETSLPLAPNGPDKGNVAGQLFCAAEGDPSNRSRQVGGAYRQLNGGVHSNLAPRSRAALAGRGLKAARPIIDHQLAPVRRPREATWWARCGRTRSRLCCHS